MPYAKLESSGCGIRMGRVQLRISMYLEPSDPYYDRHYVYVPVFPKGGYPGGVDEVCMPKSQADFDAWVLSLPHIWRNNPFHNHFVYVDPDITDSAIRQLLTESLNEFFDIWAKGKDILKVWKPKNRFKVGDMSPVNIANCQTKVEDIISRVSDLEIGRV